MIPFHIITPVSVKKNTPPDKTTGWNISSETTKSGAGLVSAAGSHGQGQSKRNVDFTDTGIRPYIIAHSTP